MSNQMRRWKDDDGALLGMDNLQTAGNREDELRERISAAQERMQ